ncbi:MULTISPECIES: AraC family transcriptional regulator [unclassified Rhizobium]|uniref:helix-turn-helix domain-containing protein n=1 Tax=unclassified Rhizobium TaxID=2613769 RepID=UPI00160CC66D|nr:MULTISPECIES: AraC family transcriptional regulator [unclassified Rhizobium]MBB3319505.1 AraC-like DNA-binding protein [Rhizobium sp. BK181]MCS4095242.1 AraC-like DNA-binding protein [Rhizobium sp. BK176]
MPGATPLTRPTPSSLDLSDVSHETLREVSRLLFHATSYVDRDEAITINLVKAASTLLRPLKASGVESKQGSTRGLAPWQINRLKSFVDERISRPISLEDLARLVRLSKSYFAAVFKGSFGLTPHNYIVSRRVEHAKHRMLTSNASLCEIALDCGLADQSHLSRVFRRATGTTPSAWRRHAAAVDVPRYNS